MRVVFVERNRALENAKANVGVVESRAQRVNFLRDLCQVLHRVAGIAQVPVAPRRAELASHHALAGHVPAVIIRQSLHVTCAALPHSTRRSEATHHIIAHKLALEHAGDHAVAVQQHHIP